MTNSVGGEALYFRLTIGVKYYSLRTSRSPRLSRDGCAAGHLAADYVFAYDMNPFLAEVRPLFERYRPIHFKNKLTIFERVAGSAGEGATPRAGD